MRRLLTAVLGAALTFTATPAPAPAVVSGGGAVVRTDKGDVRGTVTGTHRTFGAIPFAAAPVGDNRWRDPQPVRPWRGVRDATTPSPVCAQTPLLGQPGSQTEDCLYLNVTTPLGPAKRRPVMVWIHGGGFTGGSAATYDARRLATDNDAVVVTVNYRLGVFGFFGHPGLPGSGTFGLADQQAALRWVQRNARAFGGDARNVTIFGESAGGLSVCAHLASPRAAGLFAKAIIQSGPCGLESPDQTTPGRFVGVWKPRAQVQAQGAGTLGCADLACLRAQPVTALLTVHDRFASPAHDTAVLPLNPAVAQRSGRMHRVPVLVGSTHDEFTLFAALFFPQPVPEAAYRASVTGLFGEGLADRIVARYPVNGNNDARDELAAILTDRSWACPSHRTRTDLSRHTRVSGYEFADPDVPLLFPLPPFPDYRAYHASELLMLFDFPGVTLTPAQRAVSDYMITAWGRFARTGDPGWRAPVQSLAPGAIHGTDFTADHQCGFWSSVS
ncbi:para-nitrobenzyl esterase [Lentzea xinjiangensis]|uniref:Carboxylic ester hydrolase n=1 Tax=Lentzea xinjiangensis TaxID=402600 RepID=A0A1H9KV54_9PSEU|nr:carboxylesterase family protein [Lentzea xinjiangensis]SER02909.1 para-nitrobenzyl esterase [Lentzea xinjiangensis]